jgi:hypothetical protein
MDDIEVLPSKKTVAELFDIIIEDRKTDFGGHLDMADGNDPDRFKIVLLDIAVSLGSEPRCLKQAICEDSHGMSHPPELFAQVQHNPFRPGIMVREKLVDCK